MSLIYKKKDFSFSQTRSWCIYPH